jgi:uncharacterized protein (TIRG00374 family)
MNSKLISFIKFILLLVIAFGLLVFAFRGISVSKIVHEMLQANVFWLLLSLIPSIVALISRAYRWNLLVEPLGYTPRLKNTFYALMVGYFANLALPRLGEITRCAALSKAESIPFNNLLGTVIVERAIDVITLLVCLTLTAIIEFKRLGDFLMDSIVNPIVEKLKQLATSPVLIIGAIVLIIAIFFIVRYFRNKSIKEQKESKFIHLVKGLVSGLRSIGRLKRPWLFVFHSFLIWFLYFLSMYICFLALPSTSGLGFGAALFLLVAGGLGMSAPVQGGIGAYHLLVSQGLMLYGLSQEEGLTFATLVHTSQIVMIILFGSFSFLLLFLDKRQLVSQKVN